MKIFDYTIGKWRLTQAPHPQVLWIAKKATPLQRLPTFMTRAALNDLLDAIYRTNHLPGGQNALLQECLLLYPRQISELIVELASLANYTITDATRLTYLRSMANTPSVVSYYKPSPGMWRAIDQLFAALQANTASQSALIGHLNNNCPLIYGYHGQSNEEIYTRTGCLLFRTMTDRVPIYAPLEPVPQTIDATDAGPNHPITIGGTTFRYRDVYHPGTGS